MNFNKHLDKSVNIFLEEMMLKINDLQAHLDNDGWLKALSLVNKGDSENTKTSIFLKYANLKTKSDAETQGVIEGIISEVDGRIISYAGKLQLYLVNDIPTMTYDKLIAECNKLEKGMCKEEVANILGKPHEINWDSYWIYHHNKSFLEEGEDKKHFGRKSYRNAIIFFENDGTIKEIEKPYVSIFGIQ